MPDTVTLSPELLAWRQRQGSEATPPTENVSPELSAWRRFQQSKPPSQLLDEAVETLRQPVRRPEDQAKQNELRTLVQEGVRTGEFPKPRTSQDLLDINAPAGQAAIANRVVKDEFSKNIQRQQLVEDAAKTRMALEASKYAPQLDVVNTVFTAGQRGAREFLKELVRPLFGSERPNYAGESPLMRSLRSIPLAGPVISGVAATVNPSAAEFSSREYTKMMEDKYGKVAAFGIDFIGDPAWLVGGGLPKFLPKIMLGGELVGLRKAGMLAFNAAKTTAMKKGIPLHIAEELAAREVATSLPKEIVRAGVNVAGMQIPGSSKLLRRVETLTQYLKNPMGAYSPEIAKVAAAQKAVTFADRTSQALHEGAVAHLKKLVDDAAVATVPGKQMGPVKFVKWGNTILAEKEKWLTQMVNSGMLESPAWTTTWKREYELLPEAWKKVADWIRVANEEMILGEQALNMSTRRLGTGVTEVYMKGMNDAGMAERTILETADPLGDLVQKGRKAIFDKAKAEQELLQKGIDGIKRTKTYSMGEAARQNAEAKIAKLQQKIDEIELRAQREAANYLPTQALKTAKKRYATIIDDMMHLSDEMDDLEYLGHMMTDEYRMYLERCGGKWSGVGASLTPSHASEIKRKIKGSIPDINAAGMVGAFSEKGMPSYYGKIFRDNAAEIMMLRMKRHYKATSAANLAENLKQYGIKAPEGLKPAEMTVWLDKNLPYDYELLPGAYQKLPQTKDLYLPKDIVDSVGRMTTALRGIPLSQRWAVLGAYNTFTRMWIQYTLLPFPGTALRDFQSNLYMHWLAGGFDNPARAASDVWDTCKAIFNKGGSITTPSGKRGLDGLREEATKVGAYRGGLTGEMMGSVDKYDSYFVTNPLRSQVIEMARTAERMAGTEGVLKPIARGRALVDDFSRMLMYIHCIKKGDSSLAAMTQVKKYFFGREMLKPWEREMTAIIPFYSWARNNLLLQFGEIFRQPGKFAGIWHIRESLQNMIYDPEDVEWLPRFLSSAFDVPVKKNADGTYSVFLLGGWLPFADLAKLNLPFTSGRTAVDRFWTTLRNAPVIGAANLHPIPKMAIEGITNTNLFTGRPVNPNKVEIIFNEPVVDPLKSAIIRNTRILKFWNDFNDMYPKDDAASMDVLLRSALGANSSIVRPGTNKKIAQSVLREQMREFSKSLIEHKDHPAVRDKLLEDKEFLKLIPPAYWKQ